MKAAKEVYGVKSNLKLNASAKNTIEPKERIFESDVIAYT